MLQRIDVALSLYIRVCVSQLEAISLPLTAMLLNRPTASTKHPCHAPDSACGHVRVHVTRTRERLEILGACRFVRY